MQNTNADSNLLFGILALQMDFVEREQLIEAMNNWVIAKNKPLAEHLVEMGAMESSDRKMLEPMVARHVEIHQGDTAKSLASLTSIGPLRSDLESIVDPDVEQSLKHVSVSRNEEVDFASTVRYTGVPTSAGQRFRILRFHAKGGLGKISVAMDNELHREVALKEIQEKCDSDPNTRARFVQEAEITGRLEHPGIVPVYGLGQYDDGRPFYAMRFIRGDSLKVAIEQFHKTDKNGRDAGERTLELRKLLGRFIDVCNAVEYAHSRGILHRDLKPGNIMLGKYGETLVVDWGLAKTVGKSTTHSPSAEQTLHVVSDNESAPTMMGSAVGTPAFMSPEQATGQLDSLGPESDVYSLGATLYMLLTGKTAFQATDDIIQKVERNEFPPPREINSQIPMPLEAVCLKAMARAQDDRYSTPLELAEELERWLADEPVRAWREPITIRMRRQIARHRTAFAMATTAAVLLIAVLVNYSIQRWHRLEVQRQQIESLRQQVDIHVGQGISAAHAENLDQAIANLAEAAGLCRQEQSLSMRYEKVTRDLQQLQQCRKFRELARTSLQEGIHALRTASGPDPLIEGASQALAIYGGPDNPQWQTALADSVLSPEQVEQTKLAIAELLNLVGIRLAMYDTKDDAGRQATIRALKLFDLAEQLTPSTAGIWMARMLFNRRLENDDQADQAGDRMTQLVKNGEMTCTDNYLIGIFTLRVSKDPKAAMGFFRRAIVKEPNNYGSHFSIYLAAQEMKDVTGQLQALTACMALRPRDAELYFFRGFGYFEKGDYVLAHLDFGGCLERKPDYAIAHYWRGRTFIMLGDWVKAESAFSRAVTLDSDLPSPYSWRALARGKLGSYREAVRDMDTAMQMAPDDSTRWRGARALAQSTQAVLKDDDESERQMLAEKYGAQAVELLTTMTENGYFETGSNLMSLLSSDLDPLRQRDDFQDLAGKLVEPIMADPTMSRSPTLLLLRSSVLAKLGQHVAAAEAADRLLRITKLSARLPGISKQRVSGDLYNTACCFSLCVNAVAITKSDGKQRTKTSDELTEEEKAAQARYRDQAIAALEEAIKLGYSEPAHMKQDADFDAIRQDSRFKELLEKLEEDGRGSRVESQGDLVIERHVLVLKRLQSGYMTKKTCSTRLSAT